jgi:hypothetical protein
MNSSIASTVLLSLLVLVSSTPTAHAWQKMGHVYCDTNTDGVISPTAVPVPSVLVVVTNLSGTFSNAGWTAADGFFIIELAAGPDSYVDYIHPLTIPHGIQRVLPAWHAFAITASQEYATNNFLIVTSPGISVTKVCPPGPVTLGETLVFTGTVTNTGNITLTDVMVFDDQPASNTLVLGPITLASGAGTRFTSSYILTGVTNVSTNLVTLIVTNAVGTVTVTNTTVSTNDFFGTINPRLPSAVNLFTVPANLEGLTYADQDEGYAATQFYSMRKDNSGTSYLDTITAGTAAVIDRFAASSRNFDSLTFAAPDVGFGPVIFYYLSHDSADASTFGTITPGGAVGVVADKFVVGNNFDALTFSATDVGYGANLFYYVRHDGAGNSIFGTINPALPGTITDRFSIGANVDALVFTATDVGAGYGANNFYYLRHDNAGVSTFGTIFVTGLTTATVTDRFAVGIHAHELTFTATDTGYGPNLFYFLRKGGTVTTVTTNTVPVVTTNIVTTVTTNVIAGPVHDTVTASGVDLFSNRSIIAKASCSSAVQVHIGGAGIPLPYCANGVYCLSFATGVGGSYRVQYKNALGDPTWTDLPNMPVAGSGGVLTITNSTVGQPKRFYRIILLP